MNKMATILMLTEWGKSNPDKAVPLGLLLDVVIIVTLFKGIR